ncbi:hypothetical protein JG687_00018397 [Phytophthora cactorum]|uniref:Tc1-like transposase DDE domain-containing protein n=1 Tax=Phytophthora cactorum TaxID=29920 RepID=A0A8T1TKS0_9STRA|nr:hypothetical protein JG687_00018397 [Phytophthora cactorum]
MFSYMILLPCVVMTATHNGTLARRVSTWREEGGDVFVNLQPSHGMDTPTAKKYVDFLLTLFPKQQIGLIRDAASTHVCDEVKRYVEEKDVVYEFIPAGLTSIMQHCDLYANRRLKAVIKKRFFKLKR